MCVCGCRREDLGTLLGALRMVLTTIELLEVLRKLRRFELKIRRRSLGGESRATKHLWKAANPKKLATFRALEAEYRAGTLLEHEGDPSDGTRVMKRKTKKDKELQEEMKGLDDRQRRTRKIVEDEKKLLRRSYSFAAFWTWYTTDTDGQLFKLRRPMEQVRARLGSRWLQRKVSDFRWAGERLLRRDLRMGVMLAVCGRVRQQFRARNPPTAVCPKCNRGFALRRDRRAHLRSGLCIGYDYMLGACAYEESGDYPLPNYLAPVLVDDEESADENDFDEIAVL